MSRPIIEVENLGKCYRISHQSQERYRTLRDSVSRWAGNLFRASRGASDARPSQEDFWALRDVSFKVQQGEVVGIIGRNGAGKSTLLKILSRITEPTQGRITLRGRVASLLEVGTGFHPELTGRENIYLNGAILGMSKFEIRRKFDEIVAFSGVEKFLDTPVKRFSSGMYVRLAFAVAAHLEPEILVVDEVLAVGDSEFQKKCLGKMRSVATVEGRTVLFVSHNMQAVQSLCTQAILMENGSIKSTGSVASVTAQYFADARVASGERTWSPADAPGNSELKLLSLRAFSDGSPASGLASSKQDLVVDLSFTTSILNPGLCVGFDLVNAGGVTVLRSYQTDLPQGSWPTIKKGYNQWRCRLPAGTLNTGVYSIYPRIGIHNVAWIVNLETGIEFEMVLDHGRSPLWNSLTGANRPGIIAPILKWEALEKHPTEPLPLSR